MGASSSELAVPVVLSSGQPVATLPASTVLQLKEALRLELTRQLQAYMDQSGPQPPALLFRYNQSQAVATTFDYVRTYHMRLFEHGGQELQNDSRLDAVTRPICALRPSDVLTFSYDTRNKATAILFNLEEQIDWKVSPENNAIDLVVYSRLSEVFLLSVYTSETVLQVKKRITRVVSNLSTSGTLWHQSTLLRNEETVEESGLCAGSRVLLLQPGEAVGLAKDKDGRTVAVPILDTNLVLRAARILEPAWGLYDTCCEYTCIAPISPSFTQYFLIGSYKDRYLTLQTELGATKVVVPAECSVSQLQDYIEAQHGLPASLLSLTAISELGETGRIGDYEVGNGEELLLFLSKGNSATVKIRVISQRYGKLRFTLPLSATISHIKELIRGRRPEMASECELLLASTILENCETLAHYGVFENVTVHCGSREEMLRKACEGPTIRLLPVTKRHKSDRSEDPLELFDRERRADWQCPLERRLAYQSHLETALPIRLLTPKSVLFLHIRPYTSLQDVKTSLQPILNIPNFDLIWNNTVLIEGKTLAEQGVKAGDLLSIDSQSTLSLTIVTSGGERLPVLAEKHAGLRVLKRLIGEMTGIHADCQRIVVTKELKKSDSHLFAGLSALYLSLKLGQGSAYLLQLASKLPVRVEADRLASAGEVQAQLQHYGVSGDLQSLH